MIFLNRIRNLDTLQLSRQISLLSNIIKDANNLQQFQKCVTRCISTSQSFAKVEDKRQMLASLPAKDEGTIGERAIDIDTLIIDKNFQRFPDKSTFAQTFGGVRFDRLHICDIKSSPNNTILSIRDHTGLPKLIRSCGIEGFKNTRKGTNIAAQATAISLAVRALDKGIRRVRVTVRGLGPGRTSAIKGLQTGGLDIVSITDRTPVSWNPPRPRKRKKL